jgi:cupin fold WbuC family metalloprotein
MKGVHLKGQKNNSINQIACLKNENNQGKVYESLISIESQTRLIVNLKKITNLSILVLLGSVLVEVEDNPQNDKKLYRLSDQNLIYGKFEKLKKISIFNETKASTILVSHDQHIDGDFLEFESTIEKEIPHNIHVSKNNIVKVNLDFSRLKESDKVLSSEKFLDLNSRLLKSRLGRFRICAHNSDSELFQEMFICFDARTECSPIYHLDKDESFLVWQGSATYLEYDNLGKLLNSIKLTGVRDKKPGELSYCFIPRGVIHKLIITSDKLYVKETTTGPFSPHFSGNIALQEN